MKQNKAPTTLRSELLGLPLIAGLGLAIAILFVPDNANAEQCSISYCNCNETGNLPFTGGTCIHPTKGTCTQSDGSSAWCGLWCSANKGGIPTCPTDTHQPKPPA